jgi:hypothetical protein
LCQEACDVERCAPSYASYDVYYACQSYLSNPASTLLCKRSCVALVLKQKTITRGKSRSFGNTSMRGKSRSSAQTGTLAKISQAASTRCYQRSRVAQTRHTQAQQASQQPISAYSNSLYFPQHQRSRAKSLPTERSCIAPTRQPRKRSDIFPTRHLRKSFSMFREASIHAREITHLGQDITPSPHIAITRISP